MLKKPVRFAKPFPKKARIPTQLELDIQTELTKLELTRAQKEKLYEDNVELFEAMGQLEAEEQTHLDTIRRLAHSANEPQQGLNMMTSKMARMAEGQRFVVEVQYKRAADFYDLRELPPDILSKPGVVKTVDASKIAALKDARAEKARKLGKWQTPSVSVKPLAEATPPGGDPKWS